jgi:hypothetical protein
MRIAFAISLLMVAAVGGAPFDRHSLCGRRSQDREKQTHRSRCFERLVREQAVEADGDAEAGEGVHRDHDDHFAPPDPAARGAAAPEENDGREEANERADDGEKHHDPLNKRHARLELIVRRFIRCPSASGS